MIYSFIRIDNYQTEIGDSHRDWTTFNIFSALVGDWKSLLQLFTSFFGDILIIVSRITHLRTSFPNSFIYQVSPFSSHNCCPKPVFNFKVQ